MQSKISLKWLLLAAGVAGAAFSSAIILSPAFDLSGRGFYKGPKPAPPAIGQPPQSLAGGMPVKSVQSIASSEPASSGLPIRLKIPKIKVDAVLDHVGLTLDGAVGTPKGPSTAAWFALGPRPGDNGSAVITGHYGHWKSGEGSVFDDLSKLRKGDSLSVEDEKGAAAAFVVREIRRYDPEADASDVFSSNDGKPHLNLITCEGEWNDVSKTYSRRLVVFTDKENR